MAWDTYSGIIKLPDGREVKATLRGSVLPAPDYWEDAPKDSLVTEWVGGDELTTDEWDIELEVDGRKFYLHEYVVEKLVAEGDFEYGYNDPAEYD